MSAGNEVNMDFNAVYHRANDNYCYALDENRLVINIKTGYDVKYVNIIQGDPFSAGILGGGEGFVGEAINIPSRVRLPLQSPRPDSADPELVKAWKKEYDASNDDYKSVVTKIREQHF